MSDIVVSVFQLLKDDGTRYAIGGIEVEEDDITFHSSEDRTIQSLKYKINALHFVNANRPLSRIRVFAHPDAAAPGRAQSWALCNRSASLEAGKLYGFIDLLDGNARQANQTPPPHTNNTTAVPALRMSSPATALIDAGYKTETYILAASREYLEKAKVSLPIIDLIIHFKQQLLQQQPNATGQVPFIKAVFVLCDDNMKPIATAFAASKTKIVTAAHSATDSIASALANANVDDAPLDDLIPPDDVYFRLTLKMVRISGGRIEPEDTSKTVRVKLLQLNHTHDWAVLERESGEFDDWIPLGDKDDMPVVGATDRLNVYQCPVSIFLDDENEEAVHAMHKACHIGQIGKRTISFQNGGFRSSCGGPYVFRGKCVAFHADRGSEAISAKALSQLGEHEYDVIDGAFQLLEKSQQKPAPKKPKFASMTKAAYYSAESCASSHSSLGNGLIVWHRSGFRKIFPEYFPPPDDTAERMHA